MVNIDRILNIQQSYSQAKISALNKEILKVQYSQSAQINALQKELSRANSLSKEILNNQIKELKYKENQRFYKQLSFNMNELLSYISNIGEVPLKIFLFKSYYPLIQTMIIEAKEFLEEIKDKQFCQEVLEKLNTKQLEFSKLETEYQKSDFANLLQLEKSYSDLKTINEESIKTIKRNEENEQVNKKAIKVKSKNSKLPAVIIWGLFFLFFIPPTIYTCLTSLSESIGLLIISSVVLFFLIRSILKQISWRKNYPSYMNSIQEMIKNEKQRDELIVKANAIDIENLNERLINHPYNTIKNHLSNLFPDWETKVEATHLLFVKSANKNTSKK